jgi:hypothetical protein
MRIRFSKTKRISDGGEPDPESPDLGSAVTPEEEKATWAEIAHRLGRKALEEVEAQVGVRMEAFRTRKPLFSETSHVLPRHPASVRERNDP